MRVLFWRHPRTPVVELHGILAARGTALNAASVGSLIDRAFAGVGQGDTVVLDIESPGGSAVQSDLIAARIRRRAEEKQARVVAVIGEVGASGGYWLACAADEIVANPLSIVGSIGVIGGGFGFPTALARLGIERRLYTAGENKARLDPFSPERPQDVAFTHELLEQLHTRFKDWVSARRGVRINGNEPAIFDGSWMLGERALRLGLIDRLGDLDLVLREQGGGKPRAKVFRPRRRSLLSRLPRLMVEAAVDVIEERSFPRI